MKRIAKQVSAETRASRQDNTIFPMRGLSRSAFRRGRSTKTAPVHSPPDSAELAERLRQFRMFERIPLIVSDAVAAGAHLRTLHLGEFIWRWGDSAREIALIGSGFVKASRRDRNGASTTYGVYGPGDSMGLYAFWAGMRYPTDAIALNEGVSVIIIDAGELCYLAEQHLQLSRNLQDEVTRFSEAFIHKIEILSAGSAQQRLAVLLLKLVDRYGIGGPGEQARLPVFLTQEQISQIINARIETVARVLGYWKRAGWLVIDAHGWHFNCLDNLRELLRLERKIAEKGPLPAKQTESQPSD